MADAFDAYKEQVTEFREKLKYVEGASGMAVVIGKQVVGCDLFDKPSTCRKVWDRLLSGLVFDALETMDANAAPRPQTSISYSRPPAMRRGNQRRRLAKARSTGRNSATVSRHRR